MSGCTLEVAVAVVLASQAYAVVLRSPGPTEVLIPAGTFVMGSSPEEIEEAVRMCKHEPLGDELCEKPFDREAEAHDVALSAYSIDRTEVTVAAYDRCVELGRCIAPPYAAGGERFRRADYPVTLVTWADAANYCRFVQGRLPTEAEWERAARGFSGRRFPWGNVYNDRLANHGLFAIDDTDDRDGYAELAPVGAFPLGRTPDGIDDLAGNVEEWVLDTVDDTLATHYSASSEQNPVGSASGAYHVLRGGGYQASAPWLRSAARVFRPGDERRPFRGFRCVHPAADRG
jgi:formylglycine-generating enzyme